MRAREFIINIPLCVKVSEYGMEIGVSNTLPDAAESNLLGSNNCEPPDTETTTFVPPLQQKLELMKKAAGKESNVIDQIVADDDTELS